MSQDDLGELKARLSQLESRFDARALSLEKLSVAPAANTESPVNFDSGIHHPPANQTARPKHAPAGNWRDYQEEIIRRDQKKTTPGRSRPIKIEAGQLVSRLRNVSKTFCSTSRHYDLCTLGASFSHSQSQVSL